MWAVAVSAAFWYAKDVGGRLEHGLGVVQGSESERVEQQLAVEFDHPFFPAGFVVVSLSNRQGVLKARSGGPPAQVVMAPPLAAAITDLAIQLRASGEIKGVRTALEGPEVPISADGRSSFVLFGLKALAMTDAERLVPKIRALIAPVKKRHRTCEFAFVSESAINYDVKHASFEDVARAEKLALPLALVVLAMAFGTLVAAGVPLVVGFSATVVALGLIAFAGSLIPVTDFAVSIATMMGLGLGIDYALFVLMRFREERNGGKGVREAAAAVVSTAGFAIFSSGLTVLISLMALWGSRLQDPSSIALGGCLVVAVSMVAAVTLLPALLVLLGDKLERLPLIGRRGPGGFIPWGRLALWVTDRPWQSLLFGLLLLSPLILPAFAGRNGFPAAKFFPQGLESAIGGVRLESLGQSGGLAPIFVVVDMGKGRKATDLSHIRGLYRLTVRLSHIAGVGQAASLVHLREDLGLQDYLGLYSNPKFTLSRLPLIRDLFLSRDVQKTVIQLLPQNDLSFDGRLDLVRRVRSALKSENPGLEGVSFGVGGPAAVGVDLMERLAGAFPWIILTVVLATYVVLLFTFNSWLLPLSAIALNALTVLGAYGALVLIFQEGVLASWIGLPGAVGSVPILVPVVVFCLVFGLSMDYEVFMLSRISEAYTLHRDTRMATAQGLAATARVITSAASIMLVVFGAFTVANALPIKMFGLGLAIAVVIDATVVRLLLLPSLIRLAGKWNWIGPIRQLPSIPKRLMREMSSQPLGNNRLE